MAAYYAWSKFAKGVNEWGRVEGYIMPGEKITKEDIKVSDDEWQTLIDVGAVRVDKYPDIPEHVSPAEYFRTQDNLDEDEIDMSMLATETEESAPVPAPATPAQGAVPQSAQGNKVAN